MTKVFAIVSVFGKFIIFVFVFGPKSDQLLVPYILWDKYHHTPMFCYDLDLYGSFIGLKIIFHLQMEVLLWLTCPEGDTG